MAVATAVYDEAYSWEFVGPQAPPPALATSAAASAFLQAKSQILQTRLTGAQSYTGAALSTAHDGCSLCIPASLSQNMQ